VTEGTREQEQVVGRVSVRTAAWIAWALAGLSVAMFVASVALYLLARSAPVPTSWGTSLTLSGMLLYLPFLVFPLVGALIASRRPRNPIGWLCLAVGFLWMLIAMIDSYSFYGLARPGSVPFPVGVYALSEWLWVPAVGLVGTYLLLLFPDGRLLSRRWRPLGWLSGVVIVLLSATILLSPGPLQGLEGVRNPFGLEEHPWVEGAGYIFLPLFPLCIVASVVSLVLRYRRSGGEEREQIKWIAFAASFVGLMYLIAMVASAMFPSEESWFAPGSPLWLDLLSYVALLSFTAVPIAVGFAILKYRLYNIDLLINRTLVYGSLTAMLVGVYVGSIVVLQGLVRALTGQESQLAIVASTLSVAALFNPLRQRIQGFIDRRFYRRKYDAAKTLEAFSAKLRDETDLDALSGDLVGVVRETMQPAHVSLWLRPDPPPRRGEEPEQISYSGLR
jgi:hypothetical protein